MPVTAYHDPQEPVNSHPTETKTPRRAGTPITDAVWRSALPRALKRGVAGCMAAWASPDGTYATPPTVATLTRHHYRGRTLTERQIRRQLRALERLGVLVVIAPPVQHYPRQYRFDVAALAHIDPMARVQPPRGVISQPPRGVARGVARGDNSRTQGGSQGGQFPYDVDLDSVEKALDPERANTNTKEPAAENAAVSQFLINPKIQKTAAMPTWSTTTAKDPEIATVPRIAAAVHQVLDQSPALNDVDLADEVRLALLQTGTTPPGATDRDRDEAIRRHINSVRHIRKNRRKPAPIQTRGMELPPPQPTQEERARFAEAMRLVSTAVTKHQIRSATRPTMSPVARSTDPRQLSAPGLLVPVKAATATGIALRAPVDDAEAEEWRRMDEEASRVQARQRDREAADRADLQPELDMQQTA